MYNISNMTTVNISIPEKLKQQADQLVKTGYYASFSDFVRDAIRNSLKQGQYNSWAEQAKKDRKQGKAVILKSDKDIDAFLEAV